MDREAYKIKDAALPRLEKSVAEAKSKIIDLLNAVARMKPYKKFPKDMFKNEPGAFVKGPYEY